MGKKKSDDRKALEEIEKILHVYNIPWDDDIVYRICKLLDKAENSCKRVIQDVLNNDRYNIADYIRRCNKYMLEEESNDLMTND